MADFNPTYSWSRRRPEEASILEPLVLPVVRYPWLILSLTLLGLVGGLFAGIVKPNSFVSEGRLFFRVGEREKRIADDIVRGAVSTTRSKEDLLNEVEILNSDELYDAVAERVNSKGLMKPFDPLAWDDEKTPWYISQLHKLQAWWATNSMHANAATDLPVATIKNLRRATTMQVPRGTNVIVVTHESHSPGQAQAILREILEECQRRHNEFFSPDQDYDKLQEEYAKINAQWRTASEALTEYSRDYGIYDLEAQKAHKLMQLSTLETEITGATNDLRRMEAELGALRERLAYEPERIIEPAVVAPERNPVWLLKWTALENRKAELGQMRFAETAPERIKLTNEIERLETELDDIEPFHALPGIDQEVANPRYDSLLASIQTRETTVRGLKRILDSFNARLTDIHLEIEHLNNSTLAFDNLEMRVRVLEKKKEELADNLEHYKLLTSLHRNAKSNLRRIEDATLNPDKAGPNRFKYVIFGLFFGLSAGGGLALLLNSFNRTLRRPEDIEKKLGAKMLCLVPRRGRWKRSFGLATR